MAEVGCLADSASHGPWSGSSIRSSPTFSGNTARRCGPDARGAPPGYRINGYAAFWKAVGLQTLQSGPRGIAADGWALGRMIAYALVAFVIVTLVLTAPPVIETYARTEHWLQLALFMLPQAMVLSIAIGLSLGIVCGAHGIGRAARRIRGVLTLAAVATLLAFASMLLLPAANQAYRARGGAGTRHARHHGVFAATRRERDVLLGAGGGGSREYEAGGFPEQARQFRQTFHLRVALPAATFVLGLLALGICGAGPMAARAGRRHAHRDRPGLRGADAVSIEATGHDPADDRGGVDAEPRLHRGVGRAAQILVRRGYF